MQSKTPNALMNMQRWFNHKMEFKRTKNGNPYFEYNGKRIMWRKKYGGGTFRVFFPKGFHCDTDDFFTAYEMMR